MKTLIVIAHPNLESSVVNKRWVQELEKHPEQFTLHNLYAQYPDGNIDVVREQALVDSHSALVLQYPLYWFNTTPMLKQWLDEVWLYGWAYGSKGQQLKEKKIAIALSIGIAEADYCHGGEAMAPIEEHLLPFRMTCKYVGARYQGHFALYDTHNAPATGTLEQSVGEYLQFLKQLA